MDNQIYEREAERFKTASVEELFLSCLDRIWDCSKLGLIPGPDSSYAKAYSVRYRRLIDAGYPDGLWFMAGLLVRPLTREEREAEVKRYITKGGV
jgi:hypothetical protein